MQGFRLQSLQKSYIMEDCGFAGQRVGTEVSLPQALISRHFKSDLIVRKQSVSFFDILRVYKLLNLLELAVSNNQDARVWTEKRD